MAITSILRNFNGTPNIVFIQTSDDLTAITTSGYITAQQVNIELFNNGPFVFLADDYCLINYGDGEGFFTVDLLTQSFLAAPPAGGLSDTLPDGEIFVGNVSNVASPVAMSGDTTITNAGVVTIANGAVNNAKVAADAAIAYSKLADLPSGDILVGSAGDVATATAMTGLVAISNTGVTTIPLTSAEILVGSSGNLAAPVAVTGIVDLSNTGVTTIPLEDAQILVGNSGDLAAPVPVSGILSMDNTGATTIPLTSGDMLVGSAGNLAAPVAMSGAATMSNTGAVTLTPTLVAVTAVVTMTPTQVNAAYATPFQIVAAPNSGFALVPIACQIITVVAAPFADGGVAQLQWGSTNHAGGTVALDATTPAAEITAAASQIYTQYGQVTTTVTPIAAANGLGLYFSNATGAFTGGVGSSVTVAVTYMTVPV